MPDFLQQIYFLENLASVKIIFHVRFFYSFDGHLFSCEFVLSKGHLSKSTFTYKLDILIVVKRGRWQFIVFLDVALDELYQFLSLQDDVLVAHGSFVDYDWGLVVVSVWTGCAAFCIPTLY